MTPRVRTAALEETPGWLYEDRPRAFRRVHAPPTIFMKHRRRAQQPQGRQAYADSMALAAAYGRPPEPRYEQPAPQYQDPGPYRAQEPLPSQLARPAKKKRPRRKHGELARGIVRRREDWDDHCLIEMDDGRVSRVRELQGAFNSTPAAAAAASRPVYHVASAARWRGGGGVRRWLCRAAAPALRGRRRAVVSTTASARRRGRAGVGDGAPLSTRRRYGAGGGHWPRVVSPARASAPSARAVISITGMAVGRRWRHRRDGVPAAASPRWRRGGLIEVDFPSRCRQRHTQNTRRRRRASKQNHVPLTGSRTSSATATAARASNSRNKARSSISSSTSRPSLYVGRAAS